MEIKREDILHLASLSNFSLSEEETAGLEKDLKGIIKYISELEKLNTENVRPTYQVFEMENVWREDEIIEQEAGRETLLALAPDSLNSQIKVPKVL